MAYTRSPAPKSASHLLKNEFLVPVGWHAFVNCPQTKGEPTQTVPLANGTGSDAPNDLSDGQEVEILAWRPFASGGLAYQIRRVSDGNEFWLRALYLRKLKDAPIVT